MTITLGLDVSPLRIGWARVEDEALLDHGTIIFDSKEWIGPGNRAAGIEDALDGAKVDEIGMEAVFVGPNKLGSIRAAMALGQVESICDYLWPDAEQKILTASQWRRLSGVSQGGKEPVMEWATLKCHEHDVDKPNMQDAADAIAIAYATQRWFAEEDE